MPADTEGSSIFSIARSDWPDGRELIWCTVSVFGQPQDDNRMKRERRGYEGVWPEDFGGRYAHLVPSGHQGPIIKDGMMLMCRQTTWGDRAREEERRKAAAPVLAQAQSLQRGQLDGVAFPGRALNVSGRSGISKSVEPLDAGAIRETGR
jgi:hypothetical protein